jgi:hypothetical protein
MAFKGNSTLWCCVSKDAITFNEITEHFIYIVKLARIPVNKNRNPNFGRRQTFLNIQLFKIL